MHRRDRVSTVRLSGSIFQWQQLPAVSNFQALSSPCMLLAADVSLCARVHGTPSREPAEWSSAPSVGGEQLQEVLYAKAEGIARVTINRPHKHNAFTPLTGEAGCCKLAARWSSRFKHALEQCRRWGGAARMREMTRQSA